MTVEALQRFVLGYRYVKFFRINKGPLKNESL